MMPSLDYFSQEEKLVAEEYFDNEQKACHDILEQGKGKETFLTRAISKEDGGKSQSHLA